MKLVHDDHLFEYGKQPNKSSVNARYIYLVYQIPLTELDKGMHELIKRSLDKRPAAQKPLASILERKAAKVHSPT